MTPRGVLAIASGPDTARTLEFEQTVQTVDQMAKGGFAKAQANDFGRFRAGLELHHLKLANNGVGDQSFGKGPSITNSGPNPAVPGRAPDLKHHTYRIQNPSPKAKRFRWYALCSDWTLMPTVSYHGFQRITIDGQRAYDMGTGESARWIIGDTQTYTIVCEELDASGNRLGTAARYVQSVMSSKNHAQVQQWRKHLAVVDSKIETITSKKRVGLKTTYVNEETGATTAPALFIGPDKNNPALIRLLDLTPGVPRSEYSGSSVAAAIADFESGNAYPVGQMELEVPANPAGMATARHTLKTKGKSTWADWSSKLGWTSLGLAVVGIGLTLAPIPGSRVAAAAIFTSALTGGVASGLSIYDQLQQTEVSGRHIAIDVLGVAASILGARAAFTALKSGTAISLANRQGKFLLYSMAGTDVAQGLLVTPDFVAAISQILDDPSLSDGERTSRIVRVVANFALTGALIALSVGDLRQARGRVQAHLDPTVAKQIDNTALQSLNGLKDAALKALKAADLSTVQRFAGLAKRSPATVNRLLRLMGDNAHLHTIDTTPDGLLRLNSQIDIHPKALGRITDGDLATILEASRRNDTQALNPFTKSGSYSYRLRFAHNLKQADDFLNGLFDQLGLANDPRVKALTDGADQAGRMRLYDLKNKSFPGGDVGKKLKTKAADYALSRNPPNMRVFVEHFEMFVSEFDRKAAAITRRIQTRTQAIIDALPAAQSTNKKAISSAQDQARLEVLGTKDGVKNATRKKALQEMGEDPAAVGTSPAGRQRVGQRHADLAVDAKGRVGAGAVDYGAADEAIVKQVQALDSVPWKTESAAVYHANKHVKELPRSHRTGAGTDLAHYSNSAQQTIKKGTATVQLQQDGTKQLVFVHTVTDGGKTFTLTARVNVSAGGKTVLATYGGST